jgi:hypothetical protein
VFSDMATEMPTRPVPRLTDEARPAERPAVSVPKRDRPLFIIGTERSGSNLLRLILNSHEAVHVPHPPHVVHYFAPLERYYGDLREKARFERLVADVLRLVRTHIHRWELPITAQELARAARWRDVFGVTAGLYDLALEASGKAFWGCKSTFMIDHVETVLRHYPAARFIHLVRDPRDVAASSKRSVFNPYHPALTARLWCRQQMTGRELHLRVGRDSLLRVRYEELLSAPEETVAQVCAFLGEPFDVKMLRFHETEEARKSASLSRSWRNTARPILSDNAGKWESGLRKHEVLQVERIAGPLMAYYGYQPVYPDAVEEAGAEDPGTAWETRLLEGALRIRGELRSLRQDKNHWRRWRRRAVLTDVALRRRIGAIWDWALEEDQAQCPYSGVQPFSRSPVSAHPERRGAAPESRGPSTPRPR